MHYLWSSKEKKIMKRRLINMPLNNISSVVDKKNRNFVNIWCHLQICDKAAPNTTAISCINKRFCFIY